MIHSVTRPTQDLDAFIKLNTYIPPRSYRERKRSRVESLQGDIDALEEELRQLQVQQQANAALAEKNKCAWVFRCQPGWCSC